jgi:hypothetical protein
MSIMPYACAMGKQEPMLSVCRRFEYVAGIYWSMWQVSTWVCGRYLEYAYGTRGWYVYCFLNMPLEYAAPPYYSMCMDWAIYRHVALRHLALIHVAIYTAHRIRK